MTPTLIPGWRDETRPGNWVVFASTAYPDSYVRVELVAAGVRFKGLHGVYDGVKEQSYIVHADDFPEISYLAEGETCLLLLVPPTPNLAPLGQGWRGFLTDIHTGRRKYIGRLVEVDRLAAEASPAHTYDPTQHRFWLVH